MLEKIRDLIDNYFYIDMMNNKYDECDILSIEDCDLYIDFLDYICNEYLLIFFDDFPILRLN